MKIVIKFTQKANIVYFSNPVNRQRSVYRFCKPLIKVVIIIRSIIRPLNTTYPVILSYAQTGPCVQITLGKSMSNPL